MLSPHFAGPWTGMLVKPVGAGLYSLGESSIGTQLGHSKAVFRDTCYRRWRVMIKWPIDRIR
jgi:hypothetical protein